VNVRRGASATVPLVLVILAEEEAASVLIRRGIHGDRGVAANNHIVVLVSISGRPYKLVSLLVVTLSIADSLKDIPANGPDNVSHKLLCVLLTGNELALSSILSSDQCDIRLVRKRLLHILLRSVCLLIQACIRLLPRISAHKATVSTSHSGLMIALCIPVLFIHRIGRMLRTSLSSLLLKGA
jgi:hypothetical protein